MTDFEKLVKTIHEACGCNGCPPDSEDARIAAAVIQAGWQSPAAWKDATEANSAWIKKWEALEEFRVAVLRAERRLQ